MKRSFSICVMTAIVFVLLSVTACSSKDAKGVLAKTNVSEVQNNDGVAKKSIDIKASELMALFIEWNPKAWLDITERMGWKVYGRDIMRQEDLSMDLFTKGINYDAATDKFKKETADGTCLAMLDHEVDGPSWELMLADKADYEALMAEMSTEKDYKEDTEMMKSLNELPDFHLDKVFMKAVYDEDLSKMAGKKLGVGYYIMFEGERGGLYIVSFSHGNGDVEME